MSAEMTSDATTEFFQALGERGHEPALEKVSGTIRFDLEGGDRRTRWLVTINKGDVDVSRKSAKADGTARADRALFDRIMSGEANAMAAVLRGAIELEGDRALFVAFQRLFPSPRRSA